MSNKKILIVEDDLAIRESVEQLLKLEGYQVTSAKNGQEALDLLRSSDELPQLILLDLMMPVMDGVGFRAIQENDPELGRIPVVIMSADSQIETKKLKIGASAYIKKPFDIEEALRKIQHYFQ